MPVPRGTSRAGSVDRRRHVASMTAFAWTGVLVAVAAVRATAVGFARSRRSRRLLQRQLADVAERLDDAVDGRTSERLESVLAHLERSADAERVRAERAERERDRLSLAFDVTTDGVVVVDAQGEIVLRNV